MRKTTSLAISMSAALILVLFSTAIRTPVVAVKAVDVTLSPAPQNVSFVWALANEEGDYPGYRRVEGGALDDGTKLFICRAGYTPGKVYKDLCLYPYGGGESTFRLGYYQVLLTNAQYQWKSTDDVSRADIRSSAIKGGSDRDGADTLYICRKKMSDGVHPGKYSWKNRLCYIAWGGKEYPYKGSFEILFR
ncbi:MAG TPA: DM9 repeat-containing protein [Pyrinomonadaceae bacterium]